MLTIRLARLQSGDTPVLVASCFGLTDVLRAVLDYEALQDEGPVEVSIVLGMSQSRVRMRDMAADSSLTNTSRFVV